MGSGRWIRAAAPALALLLLAARHPMHTATAEVSWTGASAVAELRIRMFADDLASAVAAAPGTAAADSALSRYVRGRFALEDRSGRPVALRYEGTSREGDVVLLRLGAVLPAGLGGVHIYSGLLSERFPDQVNIVRATYGGRSATLLFLPGDPVKALP